MSFYRSTYYQVLGLQPDASNLEIKHAYRRLVKTYHPDVAQKLTARQKQDAHQKTTRLNEAYETLKDKGKRAAYDSLIGANNRSSQPTSILPQDNEELREKYLKQTFYPVRKKISHVLSRYKKQMSDLSEDIFDQDLINQMENYGNEIEQVLSNASQALSRCKAPQSLSAAELWLRYAIAQAVDGLEEVRYFCRNYNYDHLNTAANLFRESGKLSRQAFALSKS